MSLALNLLIDFVGHSQTTGAYRMSEAFQAAVGVYRQSSGKLKKASVNVLFSFALSTEAEILVNDKLGYSEAVVNLSDIKLFTGIPYAGLLIGLTGGVAQGIPV